jgi:polyhydroxyalkanoate synthesis regulator phasin
MSLLIEAKWITDLKHEILGDLLGKIENCEKELERQSKRIDMRAETSSIAWEQLEKRLISLASDLENLEKRVKRIEDELAT